MTLAKKRNKRKRARRLNFNKRLLLEIGLIVQGQIALRTFMHGKGLNDKRLAKHSKLRGKGKVSGRSFGKSGAYSMRHGLVRSGKSPYVQNGQKRMIKRTTSRVELNISGDMMRGFRPKGTIKGVPTGPKGEGTTRKSGRNKVALGIGNHTAKYAFYTHMLRKWMGLSKKDRKAIRPLITEVIGRDFYKVKK